MVSNLFRDTEGKTWSVAGWIVTVAVPLMAGVLLSQSSALSRLAQRTEDDKLSLTAAIASLDRRIQEHDQNDRERDKALDAINLQLAHLQASDEQFRVEIKLIAERTDAYRIERQSELARVEQHINDIRSERNAMIASLTARFDQGRDERLRQIADQQRQIDEIRRSIGLDGNAQRGPAPAR